MALKIEFSVANAAFRLPGETDPDDARHLSPQAIADTVREVGDRIDRGETGGTVRDFNGNTVGEWSLIDDEGDEEGERVNAANADERAFREAHGL